MLHFTEGVEVGRGGGTDALCFRYFPFPWRRRPSSNAAAGKGMLEEIRHTEQSLQGFGMSSLGGAGLFLTRR